MSGYPPVDISEDAFQGCTPAVLDDTDIVEHFTDHPVARYKVLDSVDLGQTDNDNDAASVTNVEIIENLKDDVLVLHEVSGSVASASELERERERVREKEGNKNVSSNGVAWVAVPCLRHLLENPSRPASAGLPDDDVLQEIPPHYKKTCLLPCCVEFRARAEVWSQRFVARLRQGRVAVQAERTPCSLSKLS